MEHIKSNLKQAASNLARLGDIYSQLATSFSEIERWERPELASISPQLGELYNTLKNSVFQLSNTYGQHANIFGKYFERTLQDVSEHCALVTDVASRHQRVNTRSEMIKRLIYSAQKAKSGKMEQAVLAAHRDSKLKQVSAGLLDSIVQSYNLEKESTMATVINLSAHLSDAQKRDHKFWEEVIKATGSKASATNG